MKYWSAGGIWIINDWIKAAEYKYNTQRHLQIGALNIPVQTQSCINTADGPLHTQLQAAPSIYCTSATTECILNEDNQCL